ncbi:MAG: hypothetical protein NC299_15860 [Lachnospiraceae bacterium]|nr:hypothetical protein [Lachnospiraceae bacterium]
MRNEKIFSRNGNVSLKDILQRQILACRRVVHWFADDHFAGSFLGIRDRLLYISLCVRKQHELFSARDLRASERCGVRVRMVGAAVCRFVFTHEKIPVRIEYDRFVFYLGVCGLNNRVGFIFGNFIA